MMATPGEPGQAPGGNGHRHPDIKLRMPESVSSGVYANSMVVQHTAQEFVLDFALITAGSGQIVARVVTSPGHMKQIAKAIDENIKKYEQMHGPISAPPGKAG
jgi:Protein of unknown function (DUF3467)